MKKIPRKEPYHPAEYDLADIMAIKALAVGEASPEQQKRAMQWLVEIVCGTYDLSYKPDSDRNTAFAEGKRFIGLQIVKAVRLNTEIIRRSENASA